MKFNLDLIHFLKDDSEYVFTYREKKFTKVSYGADFIALYELSTLELPNTMYFMGVYQKSKQDIVCISEAMDFRLFNAITEEEEMELQISQLEKELAELIELELHNSYINLPHVTKTFEAKALYYFNIEKEVLKGESPEFLLPKKYTNLTIDAVMEVVTDKQEYAYNVFEEIVAYDSSVVKEFEKKEEVQLAVATLEKTPTYVTALKTLNKAIKYYSNNIIYVTYEDVNNKKRRFTARNCEEVLQIPIHKIVSVSLGVGPIYERKRFDDSLFSGCESDIHYYTSYILRNAHQFDDFCIKQIPEELFKDEEFALFFLKHTKKYEPISEDLKTKESFIEEAIQLIGVENVLKNTPLDTFDLSVVKELVSDTPELFKILPTQIQQNPFYFRIGLLNDMEKLLPRLTRELMTTDSVKAEVEQIIQRLKYNVDGLRIPMEVYPLLSKKALVNAIALTDIESLPSDIKDDADFIIAYCENFKRNNHWTQFLKIYEQLDQLKTNEQVIIAIAKATNVCYEHWLKIPSTIREKENFQKQICKAQPICLNFVSKKLQRNAVVRKPSNLQYIMDSVETNYYMFKSTPIRYCNDKDLVLLAVSQNVDALKYANQRILEDEVFMRDLIMKYPTAYRYLDSYLLEDESFVRSIMTKVPVLEQIITTSYQGLLYNEDFLYDYLQIYKNHSSLLFYYAKKNKQYKVITNSNRLLEFYLETNPSCIQELVSLNGPIRDKNVAKAILRKNILYANSFSPRIWKDEEFVFELIQILEKYHTKDAIKRYIGSKLSKMDDFSEAFKKRFSYLYV